MHEVFYHFHQSFLAKERARRELAAYKRVQSIRELERNNPDFVRDSTAKDYLRDLQGLQVLFDDARSNNPSAPILEIGTGTSTAIGTLAKSEIGQKSSFIATGLLTYSEMDDLPESVNVVLAAAEFLPLQSESVGAAFSNKAFGFSQPELSAEKLDTALVPGAAVKATFFNPDKTVYERKWRRFYKKWGYSAHKLFTRAFRKRDYDIATLETSEDIIWVAVKPGGKNTMSARELLERDQQTLPAQLALLG